MKTRGVSSHFALSALNMMLLVGVTVAVSLSSVKAGAMASSDKEQSSETEQKILSKGRLAYKTKKFSLAVAEYAKIPTTSVRWPIAKEELGWTYFRMGEHSKALAQVRSLTNDYVHTQIDLEPFLLQSVVLFKNCDYKTVFTTLKEVKNKMDKFVSGMETLARGELTDVQSEAIHSLVANRSYTALKPAQFHQLPRRFFLNRSAAAAIRKGDFAGIKTVLRALAKSEDKKNHRILQNLHLVEAESAQRAFLPNEFQGKQRMAIPQDMDLMVFNNDEELWADEVDKVQADINLCASKTGRTL